MVVKGPPKKNTDVDGLFDSVRQHGAQLGTAEDLARARGEESGRSVFTGTLRTLDGRVEQTRVSHAFCSPHAIFGSGIFVQSVIRHAALPQYRSFTL